MKKRSILISAALTIALCLCLIAGSTYAIFTSSDSNNIAVNAGSVKIAATMSGLNVYTELEDGVVSYNNSTPEADGKILFENQGYAGLTDDHNLVLANMTPGDGVNFNIDVDKLDTNVAIQYRVVLTVEGELGSALEATVTDPTSGEVITLAVDSDTTTEALVLSSDWTKLTVAELANLGAISVNIFFPNGDPAHDNLYQGKACTVAVRIEAVQGNANVANVVVP